MKLLPIIQLVTFYIVQTNSLSTPSPIKSTTTTTTSSAKTTTSSTEIKYKNPIVICPGFGNDSIDYDMPLNQPKSYGLQTILSNKGFNKDNIYTTPVKRLDWIRVGSGLFDIPNFYTNNAKPDGLGYGWYVRRLKETVDVAFEESGGEKVIVLAHSAGGWLARAAMGDGVWCEEGQDDTDADVDADVDADTATVTRTGDKICCLVTMGAIHKTPEEGSAASCVTRGALRFVEENYPGAFLKESQGIQYISIGGKAVVGNKEDDDDDDDDDVDDSDSDSDNVEEASDADKIYAIRGEGSASKVAFTSYEAVCGTGNVVGDGVVPLEWTMLEGAKQIQLDGVLHSINEAGTTLPTDRWYGADKVVDKWLPEVLKEINLIDDTKKKDEGAGLSGLQEWAANLFK